MHSELLITKDDFDISSECAVLNISGVGAIVSFIGIVRDHISPPPLKSMTIEHYPGMTETEIQAIIDEAKHRWSLLGVRVIHRVGRLYPQDHIVFVATSSAHRAMAFEAAAFIMDYLKSSAPFWKREETASGTRWVEAQERDDHALKKWQ